MLTEAMATFQCGFMQVYGLTEIAGSATFLLPEDHAADGPKAKLLRSAGKPVPGARVRIVDPVTLADLPEGQTGEVLIESPGNMIGYWRNPEATAASSASTSSRRCRPPLSPPPSAPCSPTWTT